MGRQVTHLPEDNMFTISENGLTARLEYSVRDGVMDILHTIVPGEIGGRGIAADLVSAARGFATASDLSLKASCPYAAAWLERNPQ